ncbi:alpha-L-rhamnosidase [Budvicia diplopodorum]|uniref:alpha-L-rhamnosidase n=1 Tax=Budvicia diplopodorum TaxID=1119056 RepID=UPI001357B52E|nr:alpha-L-rhamnosidase [Budvicia diplopodorum]
MLAVNKITLNYVEQLDGVESVPVFGWTIDSDRRCVVQQTWQLQISEQACFSTIIHDSGTVNGDQSNHIVVLDLTLKNSWRYYARVKITDNHGEVSNWSDIASFVTGLPAQHWQAEFISAEQTSDKHLSAGTLLRRPLQLPPIEAIHSVFVHASALGVYNLHLNGQKVGHDELTPGWTSYHHHLLYQTYDLTSLINSQENVLGAMVGAGWYKGDMSFNRYRNYYGERTAFICQVVVNYKDGRQETIVTDLSWQAADAPVLFSEIYDGEIYDARQEKTGWDTVNFDASGWRDVEIVRASKAVLRAQGCATIQHIDTLAPVALLTTPQGDTVIDFGQNLSGWVEFTVQGKAGDKVVLRHFEVLDASGNVYLENLRTAKQRIEYILKGNQPERYHPHFTFQGFRYVKVESWPGTIDLENIRVQVLHSNMQQTGTFSCSNVDLNQLHSNILWGLKGNFVDVPTDCPQRDERLGWTGDAQIFCRTASYLMQTRNFFAKWLTDLAFDQTDEGGVPHVVPDILTGKCDNDRFLSQGRTHSAAAWADAAVINPWTLYLMYGDKQTLENQYASMKGWIEFMRTHSKNHLWGYRLQFGDWVALDAKEGSYFGATPNELICAAYYAWSTLLFAKAAKALNHTADYEQYYALYLDIVASFQNEFFTPNGRLAARTQTAHIVALYFNLVPEAFKERTVNTLVELLHENEGHLVTGFVGTPYFCHALSQNGHAKEAWQLLLKEDFPSWLYQVKAGATTIWEHWDGIKPDGSMWDPAMNSFNHYAYGAIGEWLYRAVAGIETDEDEPAFKRQLIKPEIGGGLMWVDASYCSVYGMIKVSWSVEQNLPEKQLISLSVTVPPNTTATIQLTDATEIINAEYLDFNTSGNGFSADAGSGSYVIDYWRCAQS